MIGPPMNSAAANGHPNNTAMMMPSSITRFVDANWNTMAAVKSAPFRKSDRARATAAYEHDDEAAPKRLARMMERGESSPSSRTICRLATNA